MRIGAVLLCLIFLSILLQLYCVRPNSGRVEPGESVDVSGDYLFCRYRKALIHHTLLVMLQALKEEPPLNTKCKDKFLIQSTIITPDKETLALSDIVGGFLIQNASSVLIFRV